MYVWYVHCAGFVSGHPRRRKKDVEERVTLGGLTTRTSCAVATTSAFYSTPLAFLLQQVDSMEPGERGCRLPAV